MMNNNNKPEHDADLSVFFDAARASEPELDPALLGRVFNDAAAHAPVAKRRADRRVKWDRIWPDLSGWIGWCGMATACGLGIWIGFTQPEQVETLVMGLSSTDAVLTEIEGGDVSEEIFDLVPLAFLDFEEAG